MHLSQTLDDMALVFTGRLQSKVLYAGGVKLSSAVKILLLMRTEAASILEDVAGSIQLLLKSNVEPKFFRGLSSIHQSQSFADNPNSLIHNASCLTGQSISSHSPA